MIVCFAVKAMNCHFILMRETHAGAHHTCGIFCRPEQSETNPLESLAQAKARLSQAAEAVKTEVAKCAVVGVGGMQDSSVAASMLGALQQRLLALCALLSELQVCT